MHTIQLKSKWNHQWFTTWLNQLAFIVSLRLWWSKRDRQQVTWWWAVWVEVLITATAAAHGGHQTESNFSLFYPPVFFFVISLFHFSSPPPDCDCDYLSFVNRSWHHDFLCRLSDFTPDRLIIIQISILFQYVSLCHLYDYNSSRAVIQLLYNLNSK